MNPMANQPSVPFPESAERRAAITSAIQAATGLDEAVLEHLVRSFYATARRDELIGHLFDGVADWEEHIARITAFWSSVGLLTGRYHGQPLAAHSPLPLEPADFARWLVLFEQTARQVCTPAGADYLMEKAHRIARSLEMGVAVSRGALPSRIGTSHEQ
jgi:hemoglobin